MTKPQGWKVTRSLVVRAETRTEAAKLYFERTGEAISEDGITVQVENIWDGAPVSVTVGPDD